MKEKNPSKLWAVNHVDDRAKDKAKKLAKQNKQSIGPWLSDLILNDITENGISKRIPEDLPLRMLIKSLDDINDKLKEISLQLIDIRIDQPLPRKNKILNKIFG